MSSPSRQDRSLARRSVSGEGAVITGLDATHPIDSAADPLPMLEPGRRAMYFFFDQAVNRSFGARLGNAIERAGIPPGGRFRLEFVNFPSYDVAPPTFAGPATWGDLRF